MDKEEALKNVRSFIDQLPKESQESIRTLIPDINKIENVPAEILACIEDLEIKGSLTSGQRALYFNSWKEWLKDQSRSINLSKWNSDDTYMLKGIVERCGNGERGLLPDQIQWLTLLLKNKINVPEGVWTEDDDQNYEHMMNILKHWENAYVSTSIQERYKGLISWLKAIKRRFKK